MIIYNVFRGDECECRDYLGSSLTIEDARTLLKNYCLYKCDLDFSSERLWEVPIDQCAYYDPEKKIKVFIVNLDEFESFEGWIGHHYYIEEYEIKEGDVNV